jgi:tRNA(Ile)-lysidine synthase TilS/MesJ
MNIDIPKHTPLGIPVKTIGVWMSGGADSALLCYLLAKQIKKDLIQAKLCS